MQILLLDMDSVLLTPFGYYRALQETVRLVAICLGFAGRQLVREEIELFEAAGVTSEWESSAICACLMLRRAWQAGLDIDLPDAPPLPHVEHHGEDWPDLGAFFQDLADANPDARPLARAETMLLDSASNPNHAARYRELLRRARRIDGSLTHRLFQELALGSPEFQRTYQLEPHLHSPSYLLEYDQSCLTPAYQAHLSSWLDHPDHRAVIFTNRPSGPPTGFFDTPEAELGRKLVGLDRVPIIGGGGAGWLATQHGVDVGTYLKPSPVHSLAALAMIIIGDQARALQAAHDLENGSRHPAFDDLQGASVFVFEDSVKGIRSAQAGRDRLAEHGIEIELHPLGISDGGPKKHKLEAWGVDVYDDISGALRRVPGMIAP